MFNQYIQSLLSLRRELDDRIDNEIEETLRGRGDSSKLKDSLEYRLDESHALRGTYKEYEASISKDK